MCLYVARCANVVGEYGVIGIVTDSHIWNQDITGITIYKLRELTN